MNHSFDLSSATILVVDDQPDNLRLMADFLETHGAEVMLGHDGADGLVKARLGCPDLILLDVMMPGVDGFELCRQLKQDAATREIPVIFLTALHEVEDKLTGFQAGGVDYLTKPLEELEVLARVDVHLKLARAKTRAEAASRAKGEFLAGLNHEIRTPLNAVLGYASLLREMALSAVADNYVAALQGAAKALLGMIENILELSRAESGKMELELRAVNLPRLMEETARLLAPKAGEKGIGLELEVAAEFPRALLMDETRIRQILLNLAGNGVKFTQRGGVRIKASARPLDGSEVALEVAVEDSGIGIPEDQREVVFEAFTQRRGQRHSEYGGTGLGLAICRQLAELMGGGIGLASSEGSGSTFTLTLPRVALAELPSPIAVDPMVSDSLPIPESAATPLPDELWSQWLQITNSRPSVNQVERFGVALQAHGESNAEPVLREGGRQLIQAARSFDPRAIDSVVDILSGLLAQG